MTEDLIGRLADKLRPVSRLAVLHRLLVGLAAGGGASALLIAATLGFRPDMRDAAQESIFWIKLAYTLALGGLALWACERLARPTGAAMRRLPWMMVPLATVMVVAGWQLAHAPALRRMPMIIGHSADICSWWILVFSLPPLGGLIWAVRGLAPTRLRLTGGVIGLAAGGMGASVYALHCDESTIPFLAIWYTLGVVAAGIVGWLSGPRLLRW